MTKTLAVLGSTGSIGVQALEVAELMGFEVYALTANSRIDIIEEQIRKFSPRMAAVADEKAAADLKTKVADTSTKILAGKQGVEECARCGADTVLNSIVGIAGLAPTLAAIESGSNVALANKETLVAGGKIVLDAAEKKGVSILPVDSEHSAIFQSLQGCQSKKQIKKLILTASGGPFFGKKKEELEGVTLAQALNHPNWSMGAKITIDSATMMNKGLELIEAAWLFGMKAADIDILVHRQSIVHSLVEYVDNSVIAQLGVPDMRIPIQYALTYPDRFESSVKQLDLAQAATLTFEKPDYETFACINLCRRAFEKGGLYPAAVNAANEKANELFRNGKIKFLDIPKAVEAAFDYTADVSDYTLEQVFETDSLIRSETERLFI
ncbi:MAG: 1-deoxy-D-xylulose-5-phosphate reductoisomerase [Clostridia bacterium]|nr:1-deoxy-D-xylulose-5-phosphate reductoisomerase [Clostridia bacterium]MBQ4604438.1 1-deoxy-D-xylulose-5-phosphate reductoisomerase [Clostridia bacterium]